MLTEEQTKEKWCPFVRYLAVFTNTSDGKVEALANYNRGAQDSGLGKARCIGSECMAWREGPPKSVFGNAADKIPQQVSVGYCGLAGKP